MAKAKVIRVWGTADNWNFECKPCADGKWKFRLPIDKTDGQYAAEIHAMDETGKTDCWVGMLYLNHGHVCVHLLQQKYSIQREPPNYIIEVERRCNHV
ncbi:MAG: Ig-like domain repeat protein [Ruminococcus flavefaciens]|nr:Ig-like domain repeat protein [Ruminococcus flavefaciens]